MTLLEDLETAATPRAKPCRAKIVLDALSPEERALADKLPDRTLSKVLAKNGLYVADVTIDRHRSGGCTCLQTT